MRFKQFISEATLIPDKSWKDFLLKLEPHIVGQNRSIVQMYSILDKAFKGTEIKLIFSKEHNANSDEDFYGIVSAQHFNKAKKFIEIIINKNIVNAQRSTKDFKTFVHLLDSYAQHEYIHHMQYAKAKDPGNVGIKRLYAKLTAALSSGDDTDYFKNDQEVMAWANSAIHELKAEGMNKEEILNFIRSATKSNFGEERRYEKSNLMATYMMRFREKFPKVWKKFLRYMYDYVMAIK